MTLEQRVFEVMAENRRLRAETALLRGNLTAALQALHELQESWHQAANLRADGQKPGSVVVLHL